MSEIVYIGGPRDGERDSGDVQGRRSDQHPGAGRHNQASELSAQTGGVVDLGMHVYVAERAEGLVAEYRGLFGPREMPR